MAITLNQNALQRAKELILAGEFESLDADWNEEKPTPTEVDEFIDTHYMKEYGNWFLGKNSKFDSEVKEHYEYPHGDLKEVQRCALVHSVELAEKQGDKEIAQAARELIKLIDQKKK